MSKFNLINYKKSDPDAHISRQLEDQRSAAPTEITEKQLEKDRVTEKNSILEKQLDAARTGSADVILERNLNTSKGLFADLRDESTYEGNLPKLEEKRIKGQKVEDEKYELASDTISTKRWWSDLIPKKASSNAMSKVAKRGKNEDIEFEDPPLKGEELDFADPAKSFERAKDIYSDEGEVEAVEDHEPELPVPEAGTELDATRSEKIRDMHVAKDNEFHTPMDAIHMQLSFDPEAFNDDAEAIREAALAKVLEVRPNLEGLISVDDFSNPSVKGLDGTINLRLLGPEYFKGKDQKPPFEEMNFNEADVGGTPMLIGKVKINEDHLETVDEEEIIRDVIEFIRDKHPEASDITEDALNLQRLSEGIIEYVTAPAINSIDDEEEQVPDAQEVSPAASEEETTEIVGEPVDEAIPPAAQPETVETPPAALAPAAPPVEMAQANVVSSALSFPIFEIKTSAIKKKMTVE